VDLAAYLARIGYLGPCKADLVTLAGLIAHHAASIPFEAIDVLRDEGVDIAPEAIFDKLVTRRRGGYCFEQNGLLRQALVACGFAVEPRLARVLWMRPADAPLLRPTHMVLVVTLAGRRYLVDAGFGNGTPTAPLAFDIAGAQPTPLETFRLGASALGHLLEMQTDDGWMPVYAIAREHPSPDAIADANLFTSTSPDSRFRRELMLARATGDARYLLLGNRLTVRPKSGPAEIRLLDHTELERTLTSVFNLAVEPAWRPLLAGFIPQA
jgi:N-hydroxyarylamine O-acetyltransferase